jgi:hypothetical protein
LFGLINIPAIQESVKNFIVEDLKKKIGSDLGIGSLHFKPLNTIELDSVYLYDQSNKRVLIAEKVSASIDLFALIRKKMVVTSAWLSDFEVNLSKDSLNSPLNIQYIFDAFKSKDDTTKSQIDIKLSSVNITNGKIYYDIKDKPYIEESNRLDVNHIAISDMQAKLALKSLTPDSLNIQIKKLGMKEKSGLEITNLLCRLITQGKKVSVRGFNLNLPASNIELSRCEIDLTPTNDTAKVLDYATLDCLIGESEIAPQDIAALVPALKNFDDKLSLKGQINGSIDNLSISDLIINYGKKMHLVSNSEIKDIRHPEKTYILGSIDELKISNTEIESIINNFTKGKTTLPPQLKKFGTISFEGDISGYLKQLTAFGSFDTDLGVINTDILFGFNNRNGISSYVQGKVYTSNFNLGKLLDNNDLNKTSLNINIDLEKPKNSDIRGKADGNIFSIDYKGYTYRDIVLNAGYNGLRMDGEIKIDDPNGQLNVSGLFDLSDKEKPELIFKAQVNNVQLANLNIVKNMQHSYISFNVDADFSGKSIDNINGYLRIDSIDFIRGDKLFNMNKLLVEASIDSTQTQKLKISSDLVNGKIEGKYSYSAMANSVLKMLQPYLPALIEGKEKKGSDKNMVNNFTLDFTVNNTENLSQIFNLPVTVISPAKIVGFYNDTREKFKLELFAPVIKAAGMNIKGGYVLAENTEDRLKTRIDAMIVGKNATNDISIKSAVQDNLVNTHITLLNDGKQKARGEFSINTLFSKSHKDPLRIDIDVLPSQLVLNSAIWKMAKSHISIHDGIYAVDKFNVATEDRSQEISIDGKYSPKSTTDILQAQLTNINLEYIFQTLAIDVLKFGGLATGKLYVSTVENKPYANTRLEITDFKFNGTPLGNLNLFSELDEETNKVVLDGLIVSKENKRTKVNGTIDPIKQGLSLFFDADSIDVSFLNAYTDVIFQNISGRGTGNIHLFGDFSDVTVEGKAFVQDGSLGINMLNTTYKFTDTIFLKKDLIYFNDIVLTDQYNNIATASGKVAHDFFHDFKYQVDLSANNFLVYNVTKEQNPIFYGTVFGSGKGSIGGDEQAVDINISMRTEDKTLVRMNFMEDFVNEYSFISYKEKGQPTDTVPKIATHTPNPVKTNSGMAINMNFYIDATPDAIVELVMDPVGGDILRGSGSGALQFQWDTKSSPLLFGTYNINRGSYNFTFQRILERRFTIEDGSNVQFRGDPFQATLDVSAAYKVNASLNDLDRLLATQSGQTTIPVNCMLNLTGPLKQPNIGLDIKFPAADPEIERQVKNLISTEDMINKQVAFLLLLSRFYKPEGNADTQDSSDLAVLASATLSNQLTKIISKIDDRWELGTNIRYSNTNIENTNTEIELTVGSRLFNDRLLINGNFGYRNDVNIQKEAMITDVDIEYLLNNAGTWRIKAYNHYNEKYYYLNRESNTQGVGIVYKKDFDGLSDLFNIRRRSRPIIKDTIRPILPDSTKKGSPLSNFIKLKKKK